MTQADDKTRIKGGIYNYLLATGQVTQGQVDAAIASFDAFILMLEKNTIASRAKPQTDRTDTTL